MDYGVLPVLSITKQAVVLPEKILMPRLTCCTIC